MKADDNKAFWQRFARLYTGAMSHSEALYRSISERIRPHLRRDMQVLALACGTGQLSFPLSPAVGNWEATDFSPAMIAEAKKRPGSARLHFSVQDATKLPYGDETFDAVVIANALHIMPHPELALGEIRRVLKPEGLLFAPTFTRPQTFAGKLRMRIMALVGFRTFHSWNQQELTDCLTAHGFAVTDSAMLGGGMLPLCFTGCKKA